eukprot:CAMPEP_0168531134 /NCGR_PEP_ID=MMETSP0405-20121227/15206_1 /TAXON_ID=498012 /ORGANISM="Trichosphaerium sp, Strain Am-I-7 wt" /LENGTH=391 /DNA_ID=CAMNT_0008555757 /DNA_START=91 /DNA_END=1266 /DNA_ORIENTATION=-
MVLNPDKDTHSETTTLTTTMLINGQEQSDSDVVQLRGTPTDEQTTSFEEQQEVQEDFEPQTEPLPPLEEIQDNKELIVEATQDAEVFDEIDLTAFKTVGVTHAANGFQGSVVLAKHPTFDRVAVKQYRTERDNVLDSAVRQEYDTEVSIYAKLKGSAFFPTIIGVSKKSMAIVMEYFELGSASAFLKNNQQTNWETRLEIALGAIRGLEFMHLNGILHCDIAARNVLVRYDATTQKLIGVLCDFGFSKILSEGQKFLVDKKSVLAACSAPEAHLERRFSFESDCFMFGLLLFYLLTRQHPYGPGQQARAMIKANELPVFGETFSHMKYDELTNLIRSCLSFKPEDRPQLPDVRSSLTGSSDIELDFNDNDGTSHYGISHSYDSCAYHDSLS